MERGVQQNGRTLADGYLEGAVGVVIEYHVVALLADPAGRAAIRRQRPVEVRQHQQRGRGLAGRVLAGCPGGGHDRGVVRAHSGEAATGRPLEPGDRPVDTGLRT